MDLGFQTIGNATVICHDGGPVLATDPWLWGPAYFGSWTLTHEVPERQLEEIRQCRWIWISHGHPDHLSLPCLQTLKDKKILLADHYGGRLARELSELAYDVQVLPDGQWTQLGPRMRVASIANYNQDAALLIDLDGTLLVDANDAGDRGASRFLRQELPRFERSFLMCLTGYGDADLIHFVDEDGMPVPPAAAARTEVGPQIAGVLEKYGIDCFAPSSSMHKYQRTDSAWANAYTTPVDAHARGFPLDRSRILPAFVRFDLARDGFERIDPQPNPGDLHPPEQFGDDWSDELDPQDVRALREYFVRFAHLRTFLGFLRFAVGGKEHTIDIAPEHPRGITFAAPRSSLMQAVEWRAFDDLLIGNYMRATAHGDWGGKRGADVLYPDFTPFVTKFGDNGGCHTPEKLRAYFAEYRRRGFFEFGEDESEQEAKRAIERYL